MFEALDREIKEQVKACVKCGHDAHDHGDDIANDCRCCQTTALQPSHRGARPLILFRYIGGIQRGHFSGVARM